MCQLGGLVRPSRRYQEYSVRTKLERASSRKRGHRKASCERLRGKKVVTTNGKVSSGEFTLQQKTRLVGKRKGEATIKRSSGTKEGIETWKETRVF